MDFLFGDENKKQIREYEKIISEIDRTSKKIRNLSDDSLKEKTSEFKKRLSSGETLDDILPEAFAVAREASRRYMGIEQYSVQLMGAIALHRGDVAQMKTGEGKTYTAPIAAYLNALTGSPVHIATSNDFLATRDSKLVTPMFEGLGLTVGVVTEERDEVFEKDKSSRKQAYSCDITYGSGNAFAFDYLKDNTTYKKENIVRGDTAPGFIIIDEADQILVNDAIMPFKLSGFMQNPNETKLEQALKLQAQQEEEKKAQRMYSDANTFVYKLYQNKEHFRVFKSEEQMNLYLGEATDEANRKFSVLFCRSSAATLTERGWLEAFNYFVGEDVVELINKDKSIILDNSNFEKDSDYYYDGDALKLTLKGLEKSVREVDSIKKLNNSFYSSKDFGILNKAIDNALKAYFVLEKGKEYILDDVKDNIGIAKKKVLLVSNGRTKEGRVYSDGLQQAIELKEKRFSAKENFQIEMTVEHDELASISQKAFYSIYPKIAGMTGTSSKELFEEVYGMRTIDIPKNSEYKVNDSEIDKIYNSRVDKDTVLFETDNEKLEATITSVLKSLETGQPVLIGTTSVNESNLLYKEFQKRGIPCEKLNAENASLEVEDYIISKAGAKGSVTISTQLAGRGTDIKLGGSLDDMILKVEEEVVAIMVKEHLPKDRNVTDEEVRQMCISATKYIEDTRKDEIISVAKQRLIADQEELIKLGGLKVIGYGHNMTKRDDDQLRGRAARQADPGVTEFYCSVNDLKRDLMVPSDDIKRLHKKGLSKGSPLSGVEVDKVIGRAQSNIDGLITSTITYTQDADYHLSKMRKMVYDQRMRMMKGESPKENMEFIIESSVINLIDRNLPEYSKEISPKKKIKRSGLDINNFVLDVYQTFGIDLENDFGSSNLDNLDNIGDLQKFVTGKAKRKYNDIRKTNGDEKQDIIDKNAIIGTLDNAWSEFNDNLEYIKFQNAMNGLAQNQNYNEIFAMKKGFNKAMIDSKLRVISGFIGKEVGKKKTIETEKTNEIDNSINDYYVEKKKPTSNNLVVRANNVVKTLADKFKVVKEKIKYQFELVPIDGYDDNEIKNDNDLSSGKGRK